MPPNQQQARTQSECNGDSVIARAIEVFANEEKALRWLGTPVRALEYATPISLIGQCNGRSAVLAALDNIEHGAF